MMGTQRTFILGLVMVAAVLITAFGVFSAPVVQINDGCTVGQNSVVYITLQNNVTVNGTGQLAIENNCTDGTKIEWTQPLDLNQLGDVVQGDVVIGKNSVFVDTAARPDLDKPAKLTFPKTGFAVEPIVLRNGEFCGAAENCTGKFFDPATQTYVVRVGGFSNYSLTGRQEFTVYSDSQPELYDKVYQTLDLNDSNRADVFKCVVQIYGTSPQGQFVLIQTNPEHNVPARLWGSPDTNNPESLGYFPTNNGLANVYFDGSKLAGYQDLEYVAQCANNSSKLVYEEAISTRYAAAGRSLQGRALWFADGSNAFYIIISLVLIFLVFLILRKIWRS